MSEAQGGTQTPATVCPYCRSGFEPEDEVTACPACGTPHHADCFAENGGCTIFGCTAAPGEEPKISITPTDFHPVPRPAPSVPFAGSSLYNLNAPAPGSVADAVAPPSPVPPPPVPAGFVSPPPTLQPVPYGQPVYGITGMQQPYAAYAYDSFVRPKSRVSFVLLAIFLGFFGAHNFYAGYSKKGTIQILVTVCTCFYAALFMWIWAIVEACTVTLDDDGVPFS